MASSPDHRPRLRFSKEGPGAGREHLNILPGASLPSPRVCRSAADTSSLKTMVFSVFGHPRLALWFNLGLPRTFREHNHLTGQSFLVFISGGYHLGQRSTIDGPAAMSSSLPISEIKFYWNTAAPFCLPIEYGGSHTETTESSFCDSPQSLKYLLSNPWQKHWLVPYPRRTIPTESCSPMDVWENKQMKWS